MVERYVICRKFGAQVHLTAASKGVAGMKEYVDKVLADNPGLYWCPRQFENRANPSIHYTATGPEIWAQTGGKVDYHRRRRHRRHRRGRRPLPQGAQPRHRRHRRRADGVAHPRRPPHSKHTVVGIGPGVLAGFLEELAPGQPLAPGPRGDEFLYASSEESQAWADRLARAEGLLVGPTSGCAMKVAADVAARPEAAGKTIVVLFPSSGVRYLAHPMWAGERAEAAAALPAMPSPDPEPLLKYTSPA